jgi:hypothetical protein
MWGKTVIQNSDRLFSSKSASYAGPHLIGEGCCKMVNVYHSRKKIIAGAAEGGAPLEISAAYDGVPARRHCKGGVRPLPLTNDRTRTMRPDRPKRSLTLGLGRTSLDVALGVGRPGGEGLHDDHLLECPKKNEYIPMPVTAGWQIERLDRGPDLPKSWGEGHINMSDRPVIKAWGDLTLLFFKRP